MRVFLLCPVVVSGGVVLPTAFGPEEAAQQLFFTAQQDNFDDNNPNTWQMAYYMNDIDWAGAGSNAPVFVHMGGEGPSSRGPGSSYLDPWSKETGALHLGVEHRYYGCQRNASSCPYDASNKTLRFLSSRQAIADVATFVKFAANKYGIGPKAKWVSTGGSYSGMLAAFVRAEYPELIHSAIANSAPIKGKFDMNEYNDVTSYGYSLNVEGLNGSAECRDSIAYGHHVVGQLFGSTEGRSQLAKLFPSAIKSAEWLEDPEHQREFAGWGVANFPSQGNRPSCTSPGCGIRQICAIMTDTSLGEPLARLAALRAAQDSTGPRLRDCEMYWDTPGGLQACGVGWEYWGYQTCTEFGYFMTCEVGSDCFYPQGLGGKPNGVCSQWNISKEETVSKIAATNAHYHSKIANVTRIVWVNGDADPWGGLGHKSPPGLEQPVIWPVSGASHCAWMSSEKPDDQQSLVEARKQIWSHLKPWLLEESADVITV